MNHVHLRARIGLCAVALLFAAVPVSADPPPAAKLDLDELVPHPDLDWLRRAKAPTDDAGLVRFLNSLRGKEADPAEVERLARALAGGPRDEAEAAAKALTDLGAVAVPVLRRHRLGQDPAGAARVRACLEKIEEAADKPLARPAMRRLVMRKAAGAADALLGYVPFTSDPAAAEDAWYGLDELAAQDPKVLAMLAAALSDKQPARRAVAACILGRRGNATQKAAVRGWLGDPDPEVRLRAAQGLLAGRDPAGVPTLIDLLTDPAVEVRWQAEELLRWLAVDSAPEMVVGAGDTKAAEACQSAWRKWWKEQGERADVAAAEREPRRPLLLLAYARKDGRAWVVGCDGVTRHEWTGLERLADAQYVPGGTVLTLHEQPVRAKPLLAERDWSGKPLWQYDDLRDPQYCQRLADGRVFIAERQSEKPKFWYQVVAAPGKKKLGGTSGEEPLASFFALRQMADGRVLAWLPDLRRNEVTTLFAYDSGTNTWTKLGLRHGLELLDRVQAEETPDGHLFSRLRTRPNFTAEREIIEVALDGWYIWDYRLTDASHAARLRGGTTIACVPNRLAEISPDKRLVADVLCDHDPSVARPCLGLIRLGFDTYPAGLDLAGSAEHWVRRLTSPSVRIRRLALERLTDLGPRAAGVIPRIRGLAADPEPSVREAAGRALRAAGAETVPGLLQDANSDDPKRQLKALEPMSHYSRYPGVVEALISATRSGNRDVRWQAVGILGARVEDPQIRTTRDRWPSLWLRAADQVVPALIAATRDPDSDAAGSAFMALEAMGPAAKPAVPHLLGAWKDADALDRARIARALGYIGPASDEVLPLLHTALAHAKDSRVRKAAVSGLIAIGLPAKDAVPKLIELYRDPESVNTREALNMQKTYLVALARVGPDDPRVIRLLISALEDDGTDPILRSTAANMLSDLGPAAVQALPVLDRLGGKDSRSWNGYNDAAHKLRLSLRQRR